MQLGIHQNKKMKTLVFVIVLICGVKSDFAGDPDVIMLSNTEAGSDQYNVVDPLDSEFYGMTDDDEDLEIDDPLSDIEDDVEDVIDKMEEEMEVIEAVEDNGGSRSVKRNRGQQRRSFQQTMRRVYRFMDRRKKDDIRDVPARKFEGQLRRVHKKFQNAPDNQNRRQHAHRGYRKMKRKVYKKLNQKHKSNVGNICQKMQKVNRPKPAILSKLPQNVRPQYIEIFQRRREILMECCGIEDHGEKKECFLAAALEKFEGICQVEEHKRRHLVVRNWNKKSECCGIEDTEEKQKCYMKVSRDIKRGKWNKDGKANARKRMAKTCRNVKKPTAGTWKQRLFARMSPSETQEWRTIFIGRRQSMRECCQKPWSERFECAAEIRQERLNRVCAGVENLKPEPLYNEEKHGALVEECCLKTDGDRVSCFTGRKKPNGGNTTFESEEKVEIEEGEEVGAIEIREDNGPVNSRITRDTERRQNRMERKSERRNGRNKSERKEKKAAKRNCCEAGEAVREDVLSISEIVTESVCTEKLMEIEDVAGLPSSKCEKIFMKCCTSSAEEREAMKQMRKEKRKEKRKERKANRQNRRRQKVETDEV